MEIEEYNKFIFLVTGAIKGFQNSTITVDISSTGEGGDEYNAIIKSNKGIFKVTVSADSDKGSFFKARDDMANSCNAIIVTKIFPTDDLKNKVDMYNTSDKDHNIHLISGDTEEKLKEEFGKIL